MKRTMLVLTVAVVMLCVFATSAFAAEVLTDNKTVTINAQVNRKVILTVSTNSVTFADADPGTGPFTQDIDVHVKSNAPYLMERDWDTSGDGALHGLTVTTHKAAGDNWDTGKAYVKPLATNTVPFTDDYVETFSFAPQFGDAVGSFFTTSVYTVTAQ